MAFYKCAKPRIIILWKTSGQQNDVAKSATSVRSALRMHANGVCDSFVTINGAAQKNP